MWILLIPPDGPVTADQFIEWLILADDANPNHVRHERMKKVLREIFVLTMGAETVDASLLRWSDSHVVGKRGVKAADYAACTIG